MEELFNLEIDDNTLKSMMELNPDLKNLSNKEIIEKINILETVGCNESQILNIVGSNSLYLSKTNDTIINLISYLKHVGFTYLNILFDSNPYILNLEKFEVERYINEKINNGEDLEDIVDELDSNPYLFLEI